MTEDAKSGDDVIKPPASNQSKVSKETWLRIQVDYESGNYKTIAELASRYQVGHSGLEKRIERGKWLLKQRALCQRVSEKVAVVQETEVQRYLTKALKRSERLEQLIDSSIEQQPTNAKGLPLVDTDQIDQITRSELRIHELAKSALRIADSKHVEVTGGLAIFNVTEAIKALRSQPVPDLTNEELERLKDCRIEGEDPPV